MPNSRALRLAACAALLTGLVQAASAAEILIVDDEIPAREFDFRPGWDADRRQREHSVHL